MIIRAKSHPRIGLIGNPSDGYFGKTIACTFADFSAEVTLYESPELRIEPSERDHSVFPGIAALAEDVRQYGYYGGVRLLKGAVKRFYDHCRETGADLREGNFTLRYRSDIPHLVGLAGSSAIICACMRALMRYYGVTIEPATLANLMLAVETEELGIAAGLQDRVVQAYRGLVYMDFDSDLMQTRGYGRYLKLDARLLPPLYMAYRTAPSEVSGVYHDNLRHRYKNGEPAVLAAIEAWKDLTDRFHEALRAGDRTLMADLMNRNFDIRRELAAIRPENLRMVAAARAQGASAKFTGSGGAIVGIYEDDEMYNRLRTALKRENVTVIRPAVAPTDDREE